MSWWRRLGHGRTQPRDERLLQVALNMPGWHDEGTRGDMRGWRDDQGDFMSLVVTSEVLDLASVSDEVAVRQVFRGLAESRGGGLIDVHVSTGPLGPAASVIYKRLLKPAYVFTGMLFAPAAKPPQVWTIVAEERGTTGVREAAITAELFNTGRMTIEDYQCSWAKDPYDSDYHGVDRSVLRFASDDDRYDERFPEHPLSKVRRILDVLPKAVGVTPTRKDA